MRCRRLDYRYALVIHSNHPYGEQWSGKIHLTTGGGHWTPAADVYETDEEISIVLEIGGADLEKLEIILYDDALVVKGHRKLKLSAKRGMYHLAQINQGAFCFELPLAESFTPEQLKSQYENGLLSITLKKRGDS